MKIIDLLNKIANGEEVPKEICIQGDLFINPADLNELFLLLYWNDIDLSNEVEILGEEKKIPEKLNLGNATVNEQQIEFKINEIIDYLKSKGE